ncbi:hypothetical protein [Acinetobacter ursingii]|uniref:hypothetical protein n=1 Tax=Acinetobacter ursingii TaxID=108980 RepID=UPI00124EB985|nr:hypothetical protein [Acinetobacter ursingii]
MQNFYLVWNEQGSSPTFKHQSYESAEIEAERLAKQNKGEKFHILESFCTLEVPDPVVKTVHSFQEDMPF